MSIPAAFDGSEPTGAGAEVVARIREMYAAYLRGDRAAADAIIAADATIWDSEYEPLIRGHEALNALRDARPPAEDAALVTAIEVTEPVVDVWADVAVAKHVFTVVFGDGRASERVRNTSVWRRHEGRWFVHHNHEDVLER